MDILAQIDEVLASPDQYPAWSIVMREAKAEITRLRALAGAVSEVPRVYSRGDGVVPVINDGKGAADIYAPMRAKPRDIPQYIADITAAAREKPIDG